MIRSFSLSGEFVRLRALEPEDLDFLHQIENSESLWEVSHTLAPYSRHVLKQYLANAHQDIFEAKQLRLVICAKGQERAVGFVDLFDFDPHHRRAGIGIVIADGFRSKGFASEALEILTDYCFVHLQLHQLYANIDPSNNASVALFTKFGFAKTGTKKQWNMIGGRYCDEDMFQLINPHHLEA